MIKIENAAVKANIPRFEDVYVGGTFMWNNLLYMRIRPGDMSDNVWCFTENRFGFFRDEETVDRIVDCTLTVTNYK